MIKKVLSSLYLGILERMKERWDRDVCEDYDTDSNVSYYFTKIIEELKNGNLETNQLDFPLASFEALEKLSEGKRIQCSRWSDYQYWSIDMGGNIYDQYNDPVSALEAAYLFNEDWLYWREVPTIEE